MSGESVLVVGAGALGMTCAYHLQLAGADISFLVRPHRLEVLSRPQQLYCYNDYSIKTLEGYGLLTESDDLKSHRFDFILLTLDGALCRSDEGVATLGAIGRAWGQSGANLIITGVGVGLRDHISEASGFPGEHLLQGTMQMFAYQVGRPGAPEPSEVDKALHDQADIAYIHFPGKPGFIMSGSPKKAAKAFADLYGRCGVNSCQRVPQKLYEAVSNLLFPFTLACELNGWQGTESVIADTDLWQLSCKSQREILGLKRHGIPGKLMSLAMTDRALKKMMLGFERDAEPMGFTAFNRFHHGGKVLAQDIRSLENCVSAGKSEGRNMSATETLLARWRE